MALQSDALTPEITLKSIENPLVDCLRNVVVESLVDCEPFRHSPTQSKQLKRPLRVNSSDKPAS